MQVTTRRMLKRNIPLFFFLLFNSLLYAQSDQADVEVITKSGKAIATTIKRQLNTQGSVYEIGLNNNSKQGENLSSVNVMVHPPVAIAKGIPYMLGADEMNRREGNMLQLQTGGTLRNKDNNMYLMFRISPSDYLLIGVISWRHFLCQIYEENGVIHIDGDGDNRLLKAGEQLPFEKIVCLRDRSWQDLLDKYANLIVKENKVSTPPDVTWKGWATWDFYAQHFLAEDVNRNTRLIKQIPDAGMNIIQIDGGWWKSRGDYFDVRDNLSGGIKAIVESIHKNGLAAGLHFDGFRVDKGANIVKEHPEYFIHTDDGNLVEREKDPVTKNPLVYWDYSHLGAQAFITAAMKNARENWGVDYFKIDFMGSGLHTKGKSYLPVTHVERYRMGIEAMRKGIKDAYFLACSPNFGVNIGLIEASRTGPDIDPDYEAVKNRAQHNSGSYYFSQKIYNCDPDYVVFRSARESNERDRKKPSLSFEQAQMWANYVAIFGNVRLESDELSLLPDEKMKLVQQTFQMPFFVKAIPMDLWDHFKSYVDAPEFFLSKTKDGRICIALFNWGSTDKTYSISGFKQNAQLKSFHDKETIAIRNSRFSLPLKGVQSVLLEYKGKESFDKLRKELVLISK